MGPGGDAYPCAMGTAADPRGAAARPAAGAGGDGAERTPRTPPRVLLVEDEPGIVDFLRRGLEAAGFAVEAAGDGVQGERLALTGRFDAVVLDLMLPRRGGLEVLGALRQRDARRCR